jgi:membrane protein involved in colicin uptake
VGLFGSGFLLSSAAAAEKAAAEKAAAEKAAAEKAAAEKAAAERWVLSDRERAIIAALDAGEVPANE